MNKFKWLGKVLSSPWTHIFIGLIFWLVPFLVLYSEGLVIDVPSLVVGCFASAGISCFDFGLEKFRERSDPNKEN